MIQQFIDSWFEHKDSLEKVLSKTNLEEVDYKFLVKSVIEHIINKNKHDFLKIEKLTIIDDGDYEGTQIFIIPSSDAPYIDDYYFTTNYYGSCCACDALENIKDCSEEEACGDLPNKHQLKELMTLCLHLIERFKPLNP